MTQRNVFFVALSLATIFIFAAIFESALFRY